MEKTLRMSLLFDFYGPLLTGRQQDVFQMYFHEDLSLGEIGDNLQVSRQAVYDLLKRVEVILEDLEAKLGLVQKHQERQLIYGEILALVDQARRGSGDSPHLKAIEELIHRARGVS